MSVEDDQSTSNFNCSTDQPLATDSLEDMDIEEELVENFVGSFTTPLYILPSSHQVYTAPISQLHGNVCFFILPLPSGRCFRHLIHLMGLHLPAENLMETNIDTCVALTVIFLSIIGFVLCVKKNCLLEI
jgi:hypothetical protein